MIGRCLMLSAIVTALTAAAPTGPARASNDAMTGMRHGRYAGAPDLPLLSTMVAAGGGARHFHAATLTAALTGPHRAAEVAQLDAEFGAPRVARYFSTLDSFVDDALGAAQAQHIALPPPDPVLLRDPAELSAALRAAGVMPDGRFDVGYFIEHLISRPLHIAVMHQIDADPKIGPAPNADMHAILTAEMDDLQSLYHLPQ